MNELPLVPYLYQSSILLEAFLMLFLLRALFAPHYMTALVTAILLLRPNERFPCWIRYPKLVLVLLILFLLVKGAAVGEVLRRRENRPLIWFIALILVETLLFRRHVLPGITLYVATGMLLYLSVICFMDDADSIRLMRLVVVASCFLVCFEPLYYHYTAAEGSELWRVFHWGGRIQGWGMWANANETAFLASLGFANTLALTASSRGICYRPLAAPLIAMFIMVVLLTGSRAGLVSFLLVVAPFIYMIKGSSWKLLAVFSLLGVVLMFHSLTPERLDREASRVDRSDLRNYGLQLAKRNPVLGVGFLAAATEGQPLHNTYVQAFAETGVPGGTLLILFLFRMGRELHRCYRNCREKRHLQPTVAINCGMYLSAIFYLFWGNQLLTILFFLIMAELTMTTLALDRDDQPETVAEVIARTP